MDPGLDTMMQLEKLVRLKARLPAPQDVATAFIQFFDAKFAIKQAVEDNQAKLALQSFRYCSTATVLGSSEHPAPLFSTESLCTAALVLKKQPKQTTSDHAELSREIYEQLNGLMFQPDHIGTEAYVQTLCRLGSIAEAQDVILSFEHRHKLRRARRAAGDQGSDEKPGPDTAEPTDMQGNDFGTRRLRHLWVCLLRACADRGEDAEVSRTLDCIRFRELPFDSAIHVAMLQYSIQRHNLKEINRWWRAYYETFPPSRHRDAKVFDEMPRPIIGQTLEWCLAANEVELGHGIVRDVMQMNPSKVVWDAIFIWAVGTGKGVDEVNRMLDVMQRSNEGIPDEARWRTPDIVTINTLVAYATSKDDPYMAERFIALGRDRGIDPDAKTCVLQMAYRLRVKDLDGALIAYKSLQTMDLPTDEDVPV
ncbi:hypothetical protein LTR53_016786, partial [Teratosphaeriaceae sp. CCFEE 6253]